MPTSPTASGSAPRASPSRGCEPQGGIIPILGARTSQQLADNLTCLDTELPPEALARLDQASHVTRGFPHGFLAEADYTLGGMVAPLDLPPARSRHG